MRFITDYQTFAEHWLGRSLTVADSMLVPEGVNIPEALADIYAVFGAAVPLTQAHNQLLEPDELVEQDGHVIFFVEDQQAALWAYLKSDGELADPVVYQGSVLDDGGIEWTSEGMKLSEWIRVMSWWQLINGGYDHGAFAESVQGAKSLVERHVAFVGEHRGGGVRFYGVPGRLVALTGDDREGSVWIAGSTRADFDALDSLLKLEWDFSSDGDD